MNMRNKVNNIAGLIRMVNQCAMNVRKQLPAGYDEKVYKNAMMIELQKWGLSCQSEVPMNVLYDGLSVGEYRADIIVEERLVLELKAVDQLTSRNEVQLVNYLTASGIEHGQLINFGSPIIQFRTKTKTYHHTYTHEDEPF